MSAFSGGASAPWRGTDLVGARAAETLSDEEIEWRVAFLTERLRDRQCHARAWQLSWLTINAGGMLAAGVQAGFDEGDDRLFDIIEAVKGGVGTTYMILSPMPAWRGATILLPRPARTRDQKIARLRRAEEFLRESAEPARRRRSWIVHLQNVALNLAGAAILFARDSPDLAALSLGVDTAIGEIQISTRPCSPERDFEEYLSLVAAGRRPGPRPRASWSLAPSAAAGSRDPKRLQRAGVLLTARRFCGRGG
jgi:hypothetical protein